MKTLFLAALLLLPLAVLADVLTGQVVHVLDGDTVYVLDASLAQHKVRLAGIDAPKRGQPFGRRAKERLAELVAGKEVEVDWYKEDRWGRLIGTVWVAAPSCRDEPCPKTLDAGLALITSGLAWHFKKYAHEQSEEDRERYAFGEEEARARKAGLWRDPEPEPPWEWRDRQARQGQARAGDPHLGDLPLGPLLPPRAPAGRGNKVRTTHDVCESAERSLITGISPAWPGRFRARTP